MKLYRYRFYPINVENLGKWLGYSNGIVLNLYYRVLKLNGYIVDFLLYNI